MQLVFAIPGFSTDSTSEEGRSVRDIVNKELSHIGTAKYSLGHITFSVVKAFHPRATALQNAMALEALLNILTNLNVLYLKRHPGEVPPLYDAGVRYSRTHVWDSIPALYRRAYGDCKSLTCARIAELRAAGQPLIRPVFRFDPKQNGTMFHILVMWPTGNFEDPSKILGMNGHQEFASAY